MKRVLIVLLVMSAILPNMIFAYDDNITIGLYGISNEFSGPVYMPVLYENNDWLWFNFYDGPTMCNCFELSADEGTVAWFEPDAEILDSSGHAISVFFCN